MPILNVNSPDLNLLNVKTPNFANYMNGVTTYATGLNAGSEVWKSRSKKIDRSHYHWTKWGVGSYSSVDPLPQGVDSYSYYHGFDVWVDSMNQANSRH